MCCMAKSNSEFSSFNKKENQTPKEVKGGKEAGSVLLLS